MRFRGRSGNERHHRRLGDNRRKANGHQPMSKLPHLMKALISTLLFCLSSAIAHAAGIQVLQIPSDANGPALKAMVWTPCAEAALDVPIGPYILNGRRNCPTVGEKLPLVVISHGHGGSYLGHHDLAETLADAGFVVAAIDHPGDTFSDMSRYRGQLVRGTSGRKLCDTHWRLPSHRAFWAAQHVSCRAMLHVSRSAFVFSRTDLHRQLDCDTDAALV